MEHLYYDNQTKQFSLKETDSNEIVFDTHDRIGWSNGKDEFTCDIFRFETRTNFYPKARHQEYIWINVYVHDVLLLPISLAANNGRFDKSLFRLLNMARTIIDYMVEVTCCLIPLYCPIGINPGAQTMTMSG